MGERERERERERDLEREGDLDRDGDRERDALGDLDALEDLDAMGDLDALGDCDGDWVGTGQLSLSIYFNVNQSRPIVAFSVPRTMHDSCSYHVLSERLST